MEYEEILGIFWGNAHHFDLSSILRLNQFLSKKRSERIISRSLSAPRFLKNRQISEIEWIGEHLKHN